MYVGLAVVAPRDQVKMHNQLLYYIIKAGVRTQAVHLWSFPREQWIIKRPAKPYGVCPRQWKIRGGGITIYTVIMNDSRQRVTTVRCSSRQGRHNIMKVYTCAVHNA